MDDVIVRPRYPRQNTHVRKRKKTVRDNNTLAENVARQLLISLLILLVVWGVKSLNTPVTNFLSDKVKWVMTQNIDVKSIYESIDVVLNKVRGYSPTQDKTQPDGSETLEGEVLPVSYGFSQADNEISKSNEPVLSAEMGSQQEQAQNEESSVSSETKVQQMTIPVEGIISSPFGERIDPLTKSVKLHEGIDIEANNGSDIFAVMSGEIFEAANESTYGKYIKIRHDNGLVTVYAHCSSLLVSIGQKVKQGDMIAKVGDTGAAVGAHLHFEIMKDGKPVNPLDYIRVPEQ